MENDEWNKTDSFIFDLSSSVNPLEQGFKGLEELLQIIESFGDLLRPTHIYSGKRRRKYSRRILWDHLPEMAVGSSKMVILTHTEHTGTGFTLWFQDELIPERLSLELRVKPIAPVREIRYAEGFTEQLMGFIRAFAQRFPIVRGMGHSWVDYCMGKDRPSAKQSGEFSYQEMYWLNVYGPRLVEQLGKERVLSTPAAHLEQLPGGAVLLLTRPTPADFDSEEARLAQARALVHLHPQLHLDSVLAELRHRSLAFSPIPICFHEDVADILQLKVDFEGLTHKRWLVERFNHYQPPAVSEWMPAESAPSSDVEDVAQAIESYESLLAEQFIALMHSHKVRHVMDGSLEALPEVDFTLWHRGWGSTLDTDEKEALIPALGAWLGMHLVHTLGGRWVPRRSLEETVVVVGSRAWLPFLRARHALQGPDSPLDSSCSQLFRQARLFSSHSRLP